MMQDVDPVRRLSGPGPADGPGLDHSGGRRPAAELPRSVTFVELFKLLEKRDIGVLGDLQVAEK